MPISIIICYLIGYLPVTFGLVLYRGTLFTCIFAGASTLLGALGELISIYLICFVSGITMEGFQKNLQPIWDCRFK